MALRVRRTSSIKVRLLTTLMMAAALVVQPFYGLVSGQVAQAASGNTAVIASDSASLTKSVAAYTKTVDTSALKDVSLAFDYDGTSLDKGDGNVALNYSAGSASGSVTITGLTDPQDSERGSVVLKNVPSRANLAVSISAGTSQFSETGDAIGLSNITLSGEPMPSVSNGYFALDNTGFNVGFDVSGFTDVSVVKVKLYKGTQLLVANTGKKPLFDLINSATKQSISTPFALPLTAGADAYWSFGTHNWTADDEPTKAIVTVKGDNGEVDLPINGFTYNVHADSPKVAFAALVPTSAPDSQTMKFNYTEPNGPDNAAVLPCGATVSSNKPMAWHKGGSLNLNWTNPAGNISGIQIQRTYPDGSSDIGYAGPDSFGWLTFNHGEGVYSYQVRTNNSGLLSEWSSPACAIYYDHSAPTATFATEPPKFVNGDFQVTIKAADNVALKNVSVDVRTKDNPTDSKNWRANCVNGSLTSGSLNNRSQDASRVGVTYTCTVDTHNLVDGTTYTLRANAGDYAGYGNVNSDKYQQFTVDRTAPSTPTNGQPNGAYLKTNSFDFTWSASTDSNGQPVTYEFQSSTNPAVDSNGVLTSGLWKSGSLSEAKIHSQGAAFDVWYWQVRARDTAGNYSAWSSVWKVMLDNVNPDSTNDLASLVKGKTVITQKVTDNTAAASGKLRIWKLTNGIADNSKFFAIGDKSVDAGGIVTYNLDTVANLFGDGEYIAKFTSTDKAGNASVQQRNFVVDNTAPVVSITNPSGNDVVSYIKDGLVEIRGTVVDSHPDHYYLKIYGPDGNVYKATVPMLTSLDDNLLYTWNLEGLPSGDYVIDLEAADAVGNKDLGSIQKIHVTVDNTAPVLTLGSVDSNSDTSRIISGTSEPNAHITATVHSDAPMTQTTDADANGNWSVTFDNLAVGRHIVTVTSRDAAGNPSPEATQSFQVLAVPAEKPVLVVPAQDAVASRPLSRSAAGVPAVVAFDGSTGDNQSASDDTAVLGASTTKDDPQADDGAVKGASTTAAAATQKPAAKLFGVAWYWWLLIVALVASLVYALAGRRNQEV